MTIIDSIILGIVEGLTEYLPVSSTGHLIITQYLLGLPETDAMKAFHICIQSGAIIAVLGLYFQRVKEMATGSITCLRNLRNPEATAENRYPTGARMLVNMIVAFLPAMVFGLLFNDFIKSMLFNAPTVTTTWALGGLVILLYVRSRQKSGKGFQGKSLDELSWKGALKVGLMQCIAMCPGVSRSLMTMMGGLFAGLSVAAAVEFSFLLGLITLGAATVHDAMKHGGEMLNQLGWLPLLVGTATAWVSAVIAVKWMVGYLNRHSLSIFGWYRIGAAIVMLCLIFTGLEFSDDTSTPTAEPAPLKAESTH
ncbi:MAG: undecaprenyl-diphosphate phosphatase [Akkermansia sp.]|nr:undecaprenyl-diphosphate phosphatase [Akkermansia sp.]